MKLYARSIILAVGTLVSTQELLDAKLNGIKFVEIRKPYFSEISPFISKFESSNGKFKLSINKNRTIDCGYLQINSTWFTKSKRYSKIHSNIDAIFLRYNIGSSFHERVVQAISNDTLNYQLGRLIYEYAGIKQWIPHRRILRSYNNYIANGKL